jgi:hypothetical protein
MNEHYFKISDEDVQKLEDFNVECICGEFSDNWTSEPSEVKCHWCIEELSKIRTESDKQFAKDNLGKIFACFWPDQEPKVVAIDGFSCGSIRVVEVNNFGTTTWATKEYLKEFDYKTFNEACHQYMIGSLHNKITYHKTELDRMRLNF